MTANEWNVISEQARSYVGPTLDGPDADAAVRAILAWEWVNPGASAARRRGAWDRLVRQARVAY